MLNHPTNVLMKTEAQEESKVTALEETNTKTSENKEEAKEEDED